MADRLTDIVAIIIIDFHFSFVCNPKNGEFQKNEIKNRSLFIVLENHSKIIVKSFFLIWCLYFRFFS